MDDRMGAVLVQAGKISQKQLDAALAAQRETGGRLDSKLVGLGYLKDHELVDFLSKHFGVPAVDLGQIKIDAAVIKIIPAEFARKYTVLPISKAAARLTVAMTDPTNVFALDDIKFMTGYTVEPVVAAEESLRTAIDRFYGTTRAVELKKVMDDLHEDDVGAGDLEVLADDQEIDLEELQEKSEEAPVVRLVNVILYDAIKRGASDIHIEPFEKEYRVRYRIDGVLYEVMNPPLKLKEAITSRLKIMARLDIAEKRLPQDGRIKMKTRIANRVKDLDFRVSVLPTLFGEKIVLRLLDKDNLMLDMTKLGFEPESLRRFEQAILKPYGMVLLTGPTGSGKTNTLYSALSRINTPEVNIITVEDPVEFNLPGVNQVQVKENDRPQLRDRAALLPAAGPQHHPGRRDPRLRDRRGGDQGRHDRTPGAVDAPHQRRPVVDQPSDEHGHRAVPGHHLGAHGGGAATGASHLRELQEGNRGAAARAGQPRLRRGRGRAPGALQGRGLRALQPHRLQGPRRALRGHGRGRGHPRPGPLRRQRLRDPFSARSRTG